MYTEKRTQGCLDEFRMDLEDCCEQELVCSFIATVACMRDKKMLTSGEADTLRDLLGVMVGMKPTYHVVPTTERKINDR